MSNLPIKLLDSLDDLPGFDKQAFEDAHSSAKQVTAIRLNPAKGSMVNSQWPVVNNQPVAWAKYGYYLSERPSFTFDPLFHAGTYYVQEASSMFLEQALQQTLDLLQPVIILDLCAAPGGKSTHIQSLISDDSVLISNEVIKPRVNILLENITKWGASNTIVTNNDPADFTRLENLFDAIVVDAPCSGSGLFRKDPNAIGEWSEANVQLCSQRQQRILADVWSSLKPGGILIYSTCSYSAEEDETIADWLTTEYQANSIALKIEKDWGIVETESSLHKNKGYRFYPYNLDGEGFYIACFKKPDYEADNFRRKPFKFQPDKKISEVARQWLSEKNDLEIYHYEEQIFAIPATAMQLFGQLQKLLNIRKAGIKIGDWARGEIIPDHALALSNIYNHHIPTLELTEQQAIQYLRKADVVLEYPPKGWIMITYHGQPLGWIKSMANRFNNYYPKDWRIRS